MVAVLSASCFPKDKFGSVIVGTDYLPNIEYNETSSGVYRLQKVGLAIGVLFPINMPFFDTYYKVKVSTHQIDKRAWNWSENIQKDPAGLYDKHASAINEILVGKEVPIGNRVSFLPQIGVGYQLDALNQDGDSPIGGIVYSCLYTDFSSALRYKINGVGIGVMGNYQLGMLPSWDGYPPARAITLVRESAYS